MLRKIRKLFKNPKKFWEDSKHNPKNKKFEHNVRIPENNNNMSLVLLNTDNNNIKYKPLFCEKFDFEYFVELLELNKVIGIYINPIQKDLKSSLCILKNKKSEFIKILLETCYEYGFEIKYKTTSKYIFLKNINTFWKEVSTLKFFDIYISTNRVLNDNNFFVFRVEFWDEEADFYLSSNSNHISRKLWKQTAEKFDLFKKGIQDYSVIFNYPHESELSFDIDLVFTWVNSDDEEWQLLYKEYKPDFNSDATSTSRFLSRDELKYALRLWSKFGQFIHKIYIVSNCKPPLWLDLENPKVEWVYHETIIEKEFLPTFSSHAIETSLHKIPNLSNHFIYSNDDFLLVKPLNAADFYYSNGIAKLRLEPYGNVNGEINEFAPDYLNAARNSNKLLEKTFQKSATQLHTHSPQSMRVDILNEMETLYNKEFIATKTNKFRKINDIAVTGYLYHHYALMSGNALQSNAKTELIQQNHNFEQKLRNIIRLYKSNDFNNLPLSVCLNDGADSHLNEKWNSSITNFLNELLPEKSEYEK